MRLVCISDTHTYHNQMKHPVPEGDVLLFAGDLMSNGRRENEIVEFLNWLETLPHKHKIFIAGNHDRLFENDPKNVQKIIDFFPNITYLRDSSCEVEGVKVYGSPYQPWFCDWAFNFPNPYYDEPNVSIPRAKAVAKACWDLIPSDTDVLVTHGPPRGILDMVFYDKENVGCPCLLDKVLEVKPKLHLFGHIHETYGVHVEHGVVFANASICDLSYKPINKPLVFDFDRETNTVKEVK